jgi:hypothetical protein
MERFGFCISYVMCRSFLFFELHWMSPGLFSWLRFWSLVCLIGVGSCESVSVGFCFVRGRVGQLASCLVLAPERPLCVDSFAIFRSRQGRTLPKIFAAAAWSECRLRSRFAKIRHRRPGALSACYCFTVLICGQISSFCD